jgi:hypothetical protein
MPARAFETTLCPWQRLEPYSLFRDRLRPSSYTSLPRPTRLNHKAIDGSLSRHLVQMSLTIPLFMATRLRACTFASP